MKNFYAIIAFLTVVSTYGQWTENTDENTQVAEAKGEYLQAIGTSEGKTYVVFWDPVGPPTNYELRVQLLDTDGTKLFGDNGILLSQDLPMSTSTVGMDIAIDATNNLYVGATGTASGNPAQVFKIDTDGNLLWGANGTNVGSGNVVKVLPLSSGETIVAWFGVPQISMQKYDAAGEPIWDAPKSVQNGSNATVPANLFELSDGGFIMVFHSVTNAIYSNLFAQRFDVNGDPVWDSHVQLSDKTTKFIDIFNGTQDGDVVYYGYFASSGAGFDSYLQRIDPDGSLPWGINGADFATNDANIEMYTEIAYSPGSQYVWAVCSFTDTGQGMHGEYVQKFDKNSGERQFTDNAKELYAIGSENVHAGKLHLINDEPLFLIKSGMDNGVSPVTLHAVKLNSQGDFAWTEEMLPVATNQASKSRIQFTKPVNGQSVAVFVEEKPTDSEPKIYAQNIVDPDLSSTLFQTGKEMVAYTNPVQNSLRIKSGFEIKSIAIYDILGRKIFKSNFLGAKQIEVNASSWNSGIYLVKFTAENGTMKNFKIVKR